MKTSDFRDRVDGIAAVEAIDDHTVRFRTVAADPSLWLKLADVAIVSKTWAGAHGVTRPADFVGALEDLRLASRQRHRPVRARIVRTTWRLGHDPQS
jgi:hypothetical protein